MTTEVVRVWDENGQEQDAAKADKWDTWALCRQDKRFPKGLIEFLEHPSGCNFPHPTPIQAYSWPTLCTGRDLIGIAKTGSGKTIAFLLPGFMWLKKNKKSDNPVDCNVGPAILVMTPTRELCNQIYEDAAKFGKPVSITAACVYGGASKKEQELRLRDGPETLIATPGRLNDFCNNSLVSMEMVRYCVLDEADRMLDMGFEPQIKEILDRVPGGRQMAMFTATWNKECRKIAETYITKPWHVQIGTDDISANKDITQHVELVKDDEGKKAALEKVIGFLPEKGTALVFCNSKKKVKDLAWSLGDKATELHGDLDQWRRDDALAKFRNGEARILVATDVASRGLDIRTVSIVVNFDAPKSTEDYIHRIGRTGRAGDAGDAFTFLLEWGNEKEALYVKKIMQKAGQEVPEEVSSLATKAQEEEEWAAKEDKGWDKNASWEKSDDSWGNNKSSDDWKKDEKWGADSGKDWEKKDDWKNGGWDKQNSWEKDDKWGKDKADDWKKDGKDEWKKDDWKKDEWKKDEWKKDEWKKDEWKNDDWKKDGKDEWKKEEWKDSGKEWKDDSKWKSGSEEKKEDESKDKGSAEQEDEAKGEEGDAKDAVMTDANAHTIDISSLPSEEEMYDALWEKLSDGCGRIGELLLFDLVKQVHGSVSTAPSQDWYTEEQFGKMCAAHNAEPQEGLSREQLLEVYRSDYDGLFSIRQHYLVSVLSEKPESAKDACDAAKDTDAMKVDSTGDDKDEKPAVEEASKEEEAAKEEASKEEEPPNEEDATKEEWDSKQEESKEEGASKEEEASKEEGASKEEEEAKSNGKRAAEEMEAPAEPAPKVARLAPSKKDNADALGEVEKLLREGSAEKLKVSQLREFLTAKGLPSSGLKNALIERAKTALG